MTDTSTITEPTRRYHFIAPKDRPDIHLPNGEVLQARVNFSRDVGMSERALRKFNLPTTILANVAYVAKNASLTLLAAGAKRRNEPPRRRRPKK